MNEQPKQTPNFGPTSPEITGLVMEPSVDPGAPLAAKQTITPGRMMTFMKANADVKEAHQAAELETLLEGIDFSDRNYNFVIVDSYQAEASTGSQNTRTEGKGSAQRGGALTSPQYYIKSGSLNKWGRPRDESHYSGQPVERVGIRKSAESVWSTTEKIVSVPGLRGKLGFKRKQLVPELKQVTPTYAYDYEFSAPSFSKDENALNAGNRTGQTIRLSFGLSKEQAESLSQVIENDPIVARTILDVFIGKTGDIGKWNAEIFDENNTFYDPGKRYGDNLRARDVRPRFDLVPQLQPEIIGLIGKQAPTAEHEQAAARRLVA